MPTTIYTKTAEGSVGFKGKVYPIKDGEASVPDEAVADLVESHGFSLEPIAKEESGEAGEGETDISKLTRPQLVEYANSEKLNLGLPLNTSKADALAAIEAALKAKEAA